jgi:hypothetical protein
MVSMQAFINEDETQVALNFPDLSDATITLSLTELEEFISVLMDIRTRMQPPAEAHGQTAN